MHTTDLVILVCLLLSAFFSGMEIAFVASNRIFLEIEKQQKGLRALGLNLLTKILRALLPPCLWATILPWLSMGFLWEIAFCNSWYSSPSPTGSTEFLFLFYQTLISTGIILLTAEFLPKVFFQLYANTFMKIFVAPAAFFYFLLSPITALIIALTDSILKRFGVAADQVQLSISKVELGNYIEEQVERTKDKENLDAEIQIFQNALEFSEVKAREAMVPRAEITAVDQSIALKELYDLFVSTGLSKILVYKDTIDDIIGYVHAFELFKKPKKIQHALLPVAFVPEPMPVNKVLKVLTKQHKSIAVVLDEYGGTAGIVTLEDIVEELFGEIEDEHDHVQLYEKQLSENRFEFSARLEVDYLNKTYQLNLPEDEFYETLGGLIVFNTEEIPEKNAIIEIAGYTMTIKNVASNKIERIVVEVPEKAK